MLVIDRRISSLEGHCFLHYSSGGHAASAAMRRFSFPFAFSIFPGPAAPVDSAAILEEKVCNSLLESSL
jgi:hypothetical protein